MLRRWSALAALGASLLFAGCGAGRSAECNSSLDCASPQECVAGRCVISGCGLTSQTCTADSDCALGMHCQSGCCAGGGSNVCRSNDDCSATPKTPVCNLGNGSCVQCVGANNCKQGQLCQANVCVASQSCSSNADCTDASLPVCDTSQNACVECLHSSDCTADPARPICDGTHHCVAPALCHTNNDCKAPTPVCQVSSGNCVGCLADTDCPKGFTCSAQDTCVLNGGTTCKTDADCSGNATAPHCKPGVAPGDPGTCVQCVDTSQCPSGQACDTNNNCSSKPCGADGDCKAPTPRCDLTDTPHACVACLVGTDCPSGQICQSDHTCAVSSGPCQTNADCARVDSSKPFCEIVSGGNNVCVQCLADPDCGSGQICNNNACAKAECAQNTDCASGLCAGGRCKACAQNTDCPSTTPVCLSGGCVQCGKDADCNDPTKACSSSHTCVPKPPACDVPPACTANNNCCPSGTPVCNTAVSPRQCVQCLQDSDCTNGFLCDTSADTCTKPPPVGGLNQPCGVNDSCNAGLICISESSGLVCRQQCDPYTATSCSSVSGTVCEWLAFQGTSLIGACEAPNHHGALGAACDPRFGDSCEWNLFCAPSGEQTGACASLCKPGSSCASGVCNAFVGALDASHNALSMGYCGAASKWGTSCATDAASGGPNCGSAISSTHATSQLYCAPSLLPAEDPSQNVVTVCQFTPAASTATGGAATSCYNLGDAACRTGVCLSDGPATCFAGCTNDADCTRDENSFPCTTGSCASSNPTFCMDMTLSGQGASGRVQSCVPRCHNESDCAKVGGTTGFGRTCLAQPTHLASSWQTFCSPVGAGSGRGGAKCASSADCASGVCYSAATLETVELGAVLTGFTPTDGFCLGSCLQPAASGCSVADGSSCTTNDGRAGMCDADAKGVICKAICNANTPCAIGDHCTDGLCDMNECGELAGMYCDGYAGLLLGNGTYGYPRYGVCMGALCAHDADCQGYSNDASTPRVCAPYKLSYTQNTTNNTTCTADSNCPSTFPYVGVCNSTSNNPNPGNVYTAGGIFGPNGKCRSVEFSLQCAPSLGAAKGGPGAACTHGSDCRTGHCVSNGTASYCWGPCTGNSDCAAGTSCKASDYLGLSSALFTPIFSVSSCQP